MGGEIRGSGASSTHATRPARTGAPRVRGRAAALSALPDRRAGRRPLGGADVSRGVVGPGRRDDRLVRGIEPRVGDGTRRSSSHRRHLGSTAQRAVRDRDRELVRNRGRRRLRCRTRRSNARRRPRRYRRPTVPESSWSASARQTRPRAPRLRPDSPSPWPSGCDNSPMITVRVIGFVASLVPPGFGPGAGGFELPTNISATTHTLRFAP